MCRAIQQELLQLKTISINYGQISQNGPGVGAVRSGSDPMEQLPASENMPFTAAEVLDIFGPHGQRSCPMPELSNIDSKLDAPLTSHPDMSWLKEKQKENMNRKLDTLLTLQGPMSWLKPPELKSKAKLISSQLDVSQASRGWL